MIIIYNYNFNIRYDYYSNYDYYTNYDHYFNYTYGTTYALLSHHISKYNNKTMLLSLHT